MSSDKIDSLSECGMSSLKASAGHASPLAVAIDQAEWPEVVGTIAGEATVLVIAPDNATAQTLKERLLAYL